MKISVKEIEWSDLNDFYYWIRFHDKRKIRFLFNIKKKEDIWQWYKNYKEEKRGRWYQNTWLIFWLNGKRVGAASYDGCTEEQEVQIFMAPRWKGKGLGSIFLLLSEKWIKKKFKKLNWLNANVAYENEASKKTFEAMGYHQEYLGGDFIKRL